MASINKPLPLLENSKKKNFVLVCDVTYIYTRQLMVVTKKKNDICYFDGNKRVKKIFFCNVGTTGLRPKFSSNMCVGVDLYPHPDCYRLKKKNGFS